jgi:thioredoxin 1
MSEDKDLENILQKKMESIKGESAESTNPIALTASTFDQMIKGKKPVIVDFYADWCAPCKMMSPIFEKLHGTYSNRMLFGRLNVDENNAIATRYNVFSIPTFIIFSEGKPQDVLVGGVGEKGLEKFIIKNLAPS